MSKLTVPVPIAAKALNLSKNGGYEAVKRGDIPSLKLGPRRIEVPTAPLRRMLGVEEAA
ncbi:MAG: DNA-binding protein [Hyphomicrobiales bacterium]|nr:MAG: DNA-binding protein [Hyphomicrobiales bacterium]